MFYLSYSGIDLLANELPSSSNVIEGSAEGLAHSVTPRVDVVAPVANYGSGFAPNIISIALWLGAGIAVSLIRLRELPDYAKDFSIWAQCFGKATLPAGVAIAQALLLLLVVWLVIDVGVGVTCPVVGVGVGVDVGQGGSVYLSDKYWNISDISVSDKVL